MERYQLSIFLLIITVRNLIELAGTSLFILGPLFPSAAHRFIFPLNYLGHVQIPILNASFPNLWHFLLEPVFVVLGCEVAVDWLKHAFITKFNNIRPAVYRRFVDVLCKHMAVVAKNGRLIDRSPMVGRKIGFAALPLSCLVIRIFVQAARMLQMQWSLATLLSAALVYTILFCLKTIIGVYLLGFAYQRQLDSEAAAAAAAVSDAPSATVIAKDAMASPEAEKRGRSPNIHAKEKNASPMQSSSLFRPIKLSRSVAPAEDRLESIDRYTHKK